MTIIPRLEVVFTILLCLGTAPMASAQARAEAGQPELTEVARFDHQVTGVTVSADGRIFVNFPRWTENVDVSLAELVDGARQPYPNAEWNG